ncbi:hypothetical protein NE865_05074 [Phthorimaea operculella]|nr:hypothetical protein NE865_05074 [Phthorimaea operculella]
MRVTLFAVASLALLALCVCAPSQNIEKIPPKQEQTPSATGSDGSKSGAAEGDAASEDSKVLAHVERERRDLGQESDLLPSAKDVDSSPFGEQSQLEGHGRIKVLPAFLG